MTTKTLPGFALTVILLLPAVAAAQISFSIDESYHLVSEEPALPPSLAPGDPSVSELVVGVYAVVSPASYLSPWRRGEVVELRGSGTIIEGERILTSARLVTHPVIVEVRRPGMEQSVSARVEHICHPCDLALLRVDDPGFFEGVPDLPLAPTAEVGQEAAVYGFDRERDSVGVDAGVVSRIGMGPYGHSFESLLLVQIDASFAPESTGGPAVSDGHLLGVATLTPLDDGEFGHIVPADVIRHFLEDVRDGRFDGFPDLGVEVQAAENPAMRAWLGLEEGQTGALVKRVDYGSPSWGRLRPGDLIVAVEGRALDDELTVPLEGESRVDAAHLIRALQMGDRATVTVLREGRTVPVQVDLGDWSYLVPNFRHEKWPSYYIFGGLVFQPLSFGYLQVFERMPPRFHRYVFEENLVTPERRQVLVITRILPHEVNAGYEGAEDMIVATVNGKRPADLADLARIVEAADTRYLEIVTEEGLRVILDRVRALEAGPEILYAYDILSERSEDLWRRPEAD